MVGFSLECFFGAFGRIKKIGFNEDFFYALSRKTLEKTGIMAKDFKLGLAFVGISEIRKLNKKWRGKNRATDVLSFSYAKLKGNAKKEIRGAGDIIICVPQAERQAEEEKRNLKKEISLLFVHGFLHILEINHETKEKEKKMWSAQDKILNEKLRYRI